jgi:hypothetical protein
MNGEDSFFFAKYNRIPRGLAPFGTGEWDECLGNHRAVIRVTWAAEAVCAYLPWRRRDAFPQSKHVRVVDGQTGATVVNSVVATCNREYGEVMFEPVNCPRRSWWSSSRGANGIRFYPMEVIATLGGSTAPRALGVASSLPPSSSRGRRRRAGPYGTRLPPGSTATGATRRFPSWRSPARAWSWPRS